MALFDKLNDLARSVGEKTGDVIEAGKLTARISSERSAAAEELKKLGEAVYAHYAAGEEVAPELEEFCRRARGHYEAVAQAQKELEQLQGGKEEAKAAPVQLEPVDDGVCPVCGHENAPGSRFCGGCGAKR